MNKYLKTSFVDAFADISEADILSAKLKHQVARFLYLYRTQHGWQQKHLAEKLDITQGMVSKWESSNCNFSIESLAALLSKLNVDADFVIAPKNTEIVSPLPYETVTRKSSISKEDFENYLLTAS